MMQDLNSFAMERPYVVSTMAADDLAMQGAKASAVCKDQILSEYFGLHIRRVIAESADIFTANYTRPSADTVLTNRIL